MKVYNFEREFRSFALVKLKTASVYIDTVYSNMIVMMYSY